MDGRPSRWITHPYSFAAADALTRELGVSRTTAAMLVRRGYDTAAAARAFLDPRDRHDPAALGDMADACRMVLGHVASRSRIVVHGDYDVDGVCATAVLVRALRRLGADVGWHIPSRFEEGYGLAVETVEKLAAQGAGLIVTVDCGITATAAVGRAHELGIEVVVSDHHKPGDELPACPIVHPAFGGYAYDSLCGSAVAHKLAQALSAAAGADPSDTDADMDLVGLATLCDLVPLTGENRRIAREGIAALQRTRNVGLRALMEVAGVAPADCDERAAGFRLGPRINAAGRMQRADAALELLMTDDGDRALEVARELEELNRERRDEEQRVTWEAEAAAAAFAHQAALVVAGEGWHPGVVGIVASRLVERFSRPAVVIAIDGDVARGSARSISPFDLHAGIAACAEHLVRFGGHPMAAGVELRAESVGAFRSAFAAHAGSLLTPHDLVPCERVDAVVSGGSAGLSLADELTALGPFGPGNASPTLLLPAARLESIRAMGDEGQHARLTVRSGGARVEAVAFRASAGALKRMSEEQHDLAVRLERNEWNGAVSPRLMLRAVCPPRRGRLNTLERNGDDYFAALADALDQHPAGPWTLRAIGPAARAMVERRGDGPAAVAADLLTTGEGVLVVCADVARRRDSLEKLLCGIGELAAVSWDGLATDPDLARPYPHVVAMDPPPLQAGESLLGALRAEAPAAFAHFAWGAAEAEFVLAVARGAYELRPAVTAFYKMLRDAGGELAGGELQAALVGEGRYPRPAAVAARIVRIVGELGLASFERSDVVVARLEPVDGRRELEKSKTYKACRALLADTESYLARGRRRAREAA